MEFSCTEEEFRVFEKVVEEDDPWASFGFYMALVLLGLKPATCPSTRLELEEFRDEIEEIGLHIKRIRLDFVDFDELPDYMEEEEYDKPYFVARNSERLEMLKDRYGEDEEKQYDRDFALFLGYPEEDVKWFVENIGGHSEAYEKSKEKLGDPEDFDFVTSTVMYIPKPTEEAYQRARETAEKYIAALNEADKKFDSDVGDKLIEVQCDR
jgi:hypothetical protein